MENYEPTEEEIAVFGTARNVINTFKFMIADPSFDPALGAFQLFMTGCLVGAQDPEAGMAVVKVMKQAYDDPSKVEFGAYSSASEILEHLKETYTQEDREIVKQIIRELPSNAD